MFIDKQGLIDIIDGIKLEVAGGKQQSFYLDLTLFAVDSSFVTQATAIQHILEKASSAYYTRQNNAKMHDLRSRRQGPTQTR